MSEVFFISDLHLGHRGILGFAGDLRQGKNVTEHDEWIIETWNSVVDHSDRVYVLGDVAFGREALRNVVRLRGTKFLVRGNHDEQSTASYLEYFNQVYGFFKWEKFWLSHAPMHPLELRGKMNMHGHVHMNSIPDSNYLNVCVENLRGIPISATRLRELFYRADGLGHAAPEFVLPR